MFVKDYIGREISVHDDVCQVAQKRLMPAGGTIYSDGKVIVFHHLYAPILNFFVLAPIRHVETEDDLSVEEKESMQIATQKLQEFLEKENMPTKKVSFTGAYDHHFKVWFIPDIEPFRHGINASIFTDKKAMERAQYPVAEAYDIMYIIRRLRGFFDNES